MAASAVSGSLIPTAAAQCPDVQVVFARGTGEEPGVGPTGQAFVDALHQRVGDRSFDVYPVNYPATDQWDTGIDGIRDAGAHVVSMAHDCPNTKMVLGGYSQGAAVMGFVTSAAVPEGIDPATVPKPLSPDVANHVSSVVLFGMPNVRAMNFLGEPPRRHRTRLPRQNPQSLRHRRPRLLRRHELRRPQHLRRRRLHHRQRRRLRLQPPRHG